MQRVWLSYHNGSVDVRNADRTGGPDQSAARHEKPERNALVGHCGWVEGGVSALLNAILLSLCLWAGSQKWCGFYRSICARSRLPKKVISRTSGARLVHTQVRAVCRLCVRRILHAHRHNQNGCLSVLCSVQTNTPVIPFVRSCMEEFIFVTQYLRPDEETHVQYGLLDKGLWPSVCHRIVGHSNNRQLYQK